LQSRGRTIARDLTGPSEFWQRGFRKARSAQCRKLYRRHTLWRPPVLSSSTARALSCRDPNRWKMPVSVWDSGDELYFVPMPNSIVHFEIPADDVKRAKKFYEKALGWKITDPWKMDYFLVETKEKGEDGINGGLMPRKNPGQPFMNYISVDSIDASLKK